MSVNHLLINYFNDCIRQNKIVKNRSSFTTGDDDMASILGDDASIT